MKTLMKLAKEVAPLTEDVVFITPAAGKKVYLTKFIGEAAFDKTTAVYVAWDYNGAGEQIIFSTKGSLKLYDKFEIGVGDGVKKVALVLNNTNDSQTVIMTGTAVIVEE